MPTSPSAITALPAAPDPNDRSTFNTRAYPWSAALVTWTTQANSIATVTYDNAVEAATSASNAASSASSASASATSAGASATSAGASYANFAGKYLGSKTVNPTLDNEGNALLVGALYFNSAASEMRVWSGSSWVSAYIPATGYATTGYVTTSIADAIAAIPPAVVTGSDLYQAAIFGAL